MTENLDPLLAAFAELVVARQVPFAALSEGLKGHLVAAATRRADGKATDSKLSVMTGLQRRDIVRLRAFRAKERRETPLSRIVALWQSNPDYAPAGISRPIPRTGGPPSFDHLARLVRQDVHPRTFLDSLLEAGTVRQDGETLTLLHTAYVPPGGSDDQVAYLSANVGDHLRAAIANLDGRDPPLFERALHYSDLTQDQVDTLKAVFEETLMKLLKDLGNRAETMKRANTTPGDQRVRLGGYAFNVQRDTP